MPVLIDGKFRIFESHAILKYIHAKYARPEHDHWYPKEDYVTKAKIDEYLDWHHLNLKLNATGFLVASISTPVARRARFGKDYKETKFEIYEKESFRVQMH